MKRIAIAFALTLIAGAANAETVFDKTLAMWAPKTIEQSDGVMTVVLPQPRVTAEIYEAVIKSGVCSALSLDEAALDGVKEIRVLNTHSVRGFVAEGGKDLCAELETEPAGQGQSITLLAVTHTY